MVVISLMQGLHQVAQKLSMIGLPSLTIFEVLKGFPFMSLISTEGSCLFFVMVISWEKAPVIKNNNVVSEMMNFVM